jgi:hypothetical protein
MNSLMDEMIAAERRQDCLRTSAKEQWMKDVQRATNAAKLPNRLLAFAIHAFTFRNG